MNCILFSNFRSKWEGDIPPYKLIFSDGWVPGVIDFPEDDQDDLSQVTDYNLVKELSKPKSFSPPASSPKENKQMPQQVRRMERQVKYFRSYYLFSRKYLLLFYNLINQPKLA